MSWIKSLLSFGPPLCSAVLIGIVSSVVDDQSQWKLPLLLLSLFPCFLPWRTWLVHLLRRREQSGDQRAPYRFWGFHAAFSKAVRIKFLA